MVREQLQQAVRTALMSVLEAEVDAVIGAARDAHTEQQRDYRNGHYARSLETSLGHIDDLSVPRTRGGYQMQVFERSHRRRSEQDQTIGEMFIGGASMARGGSDPPAQTISGSIWRRYDFMRLWKNAPGTTYRDSTSFPTVKAVTYHCFVCHSIRKSRATSRLRERNNQFWSGRGQRRQLRRNLSILLGGTFTG